jgi:hypothetical protein
MEELKLTGNHLKGSRPLLTFSSNFDQQPHWKLLKEMITQVRGWFGMLHHSVHVLCQPFAQTDIDLCSSFFAKNHFFLFTLCSNLVSKEITLDFMTSVYHKGIFITLKCATVVLD